MTTIITKNSSTASAVPSAGSLVQGELAVNVTDKKLYIKDNTGAVVVLASNSGVADAAASASAAASSASAAATSASNASTSATAATSAKTAAEAARDATLAAYDNFDDRYLGTKTSDPTLDNDGNALVAGALYFNSVSGIMKLYTGSAWVAAYVSGEGYVTLTGSETLTNKTIEFVDGTASAPAITNVGDTNTGIFFPAADTIGFAEGGAEVARITNTGAWSFGSSGTATGTTGQVLTSQGSGAAPTWNTISSGGMTLLATLTPASGVTSISATGLAAFKALEIVAAGVVLTGAGTSLTAKISSDNGSTYSAATLAWASSALTPKGAAKIYRTDGTSVKIGITNTSTSTIEFTDVTAAVNAVLISLGNTASNTFSGVGSIYIYGIN